MQITNVVDWRQHLLRKARSLIEDGVHQLRVGQRVSVRQLRDAVKLGKFVQGKAHVL